MLLSTRDAQLERRCSHSLAIDAIVDRLSLRGTDNASFHGDATSELHAPSVLSRALSNTNLSQGVVALEIERIGTLTDERPAPPTPAKSRYRWRMTHYFYIHVVLFIINGFFCGMIVWLIENHSSARNLQMDVAYVDAWFVASSCVYNCGLTSMDFAKLSKASQIVLMICTFLSGITISTLPALVVKAHTHKNVAGLTVDDDHGELGEEEDDLPTFNIRRRRNLPAHIRERLASLPTAAQIRYRAYIGCIALILGTCFIIYSLIFVGIGAWLDGQYTAEQLMQGNASINPYYVSFIVTITGFNQNGLTPFSDGFSRFVHDVYLNLFVILVSEANPFAPLHRSICRW